MNTFATLEMWEPFRESLISSHLFYVEQAQKRLLSQFNNLKEEADRASAEYLERSAPNFDPERHDPGDFYEAAGEAGVEFYQLLNDMRTQTQLSVVAGMFHRWEKELRDWLYQKTWFWNKDSKARAALLNANFGAMIDLLESLGWEQRSKPYFEALDACRCVVNVYKHGPGSSFETLKKRYPDYLRDPTATPESLLADIDFTNHTHLRVSEDQIHAFSAAIESFWRAVPAQILNTEQRKSLPKWFTTRSTAPAPEAAALTPPSDSQSQPGKSC